MSRKQNRRRHESRKTANVKINSASPDKVEPNNISDIKTTNSGQSVDSTQNNLGKSLIQTIISPELVDVMANLVEVGLDSVMNDGIMRDIPFLGSFIGVSKAVISIRDKLLVQKILRFLRELSNTTEEERKKFIQGFEEDTKEQQKVGENLLMLLDRLDDLDKPAMVAKLLKAYKKGEITSFDDFVYYSSIVDRAFMLDLSALLSNFSTGSVGGLDEDWFGRRFYHLGLSFMTVTVNPDFQPAPSGVLDRLQYNLGQQSRPTNRANVKFKLSESAYIFAKILLGDDYKGGEFPSDPADWQSL